MIGRLARLLVLVAAGTGMLIAAYTLINTTFMLYDDEGYVLLTYRNFIAGGRLYDEVFTQYGPWPYVYHLAVNWVLHTPLTHNIGRSLTSVHWTLTALLVGAIATRLTAQKLYALPAAFACFGLLWQISSEPSHPGSLLCLVLALTCLLLLNAHDRQHWTMLAVSAGIGTALLVMTKINIGLLFMTGVGVAALRLTAWPLRWQTPALIVSALGLLFVPWGLMGGNLSKSWVLILAVQFTLSAAGFLWVSPTDPAQRIIPAHTWLTAAVLFILTLLVLTAVVALRGTTLSAILQAVLLNPLRQPASFVLGFTWQSWLWPLSIVCWAITARAGWELRHRGGALTARIWWTVITLRLAVLGWFILNLKEWLTLPGINTVMGASLPLLPVFLVPLSRDARPVSGLKLWAAAVALPQTLHTYPVAGSQMGWGTFLLVPLLFAGWHDVAAALTKQWPRHTRWTLVGLGATLSIAGLLQIGMLLHTARARYITSKPFGLPGAEAVRAGDQARLLLRILTLNAAVHSDVLYSRQGMFSYNLWSGVPTPTMQNATHWFWLLDHPAQHAIIERLRTTPRSAIIVSRDLDHFLQNIGVPMECPLQSFIEEYYRPLFSLGGFDFLLPHETRAVPFGRIEIFNATPSSNAPSPILWQTHLALNGQLTEIQLRSINHPWTVHATWSPSRVRIGVQRINPAGDITGPETILPHDQPFRGLYRLNLYLEHAPNPDRPQELELVGLDPAGQTVFESAF